MVVRSHLILQTHEMQHRQPLIQTVRAEVQEEKVQKQTAIINIYIRCKQSCSNCALCLKQVPTFKH